MDDTRRALLRSWLTKAASDLKSARVLGSVDDAPLDTAIYHCQQTAEKAVKAFLVSKELSPEKTHDIRRLTIEAAGHEPRFNEMMELAVSLTPYAWEFRYPDDLADTYPTREEFDEALQHAQAIFDFVLSCSQRRRGRENHRRLPQMRRGFWPPGGGREGAMAKGQGCGSSRGQFGETDAKVYANA
jgi:HEPN domain-containing protein